jgi:hypothetical protein
MNYSPELPEPEHTAPANRDWVASAKEDQRLGSRKKRATEIRRLRNRDRLLTRDRKDY